MQTAISLIGAPLKLVGAYALQLHLAALVVALVMAVVFDVRYRRIPNWLVGIGTVWAIGFHAFSASGSGPLFALGGFAVGLAAFVPLYAIGVMGAGDVKLMGMTSAFLGASESVPAILMTLIAGGVLSLAAAVRLRMMGQLVANLRTMAVNTFIDALHGHTRAANEMPSIGKTPYALAIAAGTFIQIFVMRA